MITLFQVVSEDVRIKRSWLCLNRFNPVERKTFKLRIKILCDFCYIEYMNVIWVFREGFTNWPHSFDTQRRTWKELWYNCVFLPIKDSQKHPCGYNNNVLLTAVEITLHEDLWSISIRVSKEGLIIGFALMSGDLGERMFTIYQIVRIARHCAVCFILSFLGLSVILIF